MRNIFSEPEALKSVICWNAVPGNTGVVNPDFFGNIPAHAGASPPDFFCSMRKNTRASPSYFFGNTGVFFRGFFLNFLVPSG
jgi:hypothetical protein